MVSRPFCPNPRSLMAVVKSGSSGTVATAATAVSTAGSWPAWWPALGRRCWPLPPSSSAATVTTVSLASSIDAPSVCGRSARVFGRWPCSSGRAGRRIRRPCSSCSSSSSFFRRRLRSSSHRCPRPPPRPPFDKDEKLLMLAIILMKITCF